MSLQEWMRIKLSVDHLRLMSNSLQRAIIITTSIIVQLLSSSLTLSLLLSLTYFEIKEGKFTTAWSGQYHQESKDGEVLLTTWIMTANQQDPEEYWKAVNIGQGRFTRMPWVENYKWSCKQIPLVKGCRPFQHNLACRMKLHDFVTRWHKCIFQ